MLLIAYRFSFFSWLKWCLFFLNLFVSIQAIASQNSNDNKIILQFIRISVLDDDVIRLEFDPNKKFKDENTFVITNRNPLNETVHFEQQVTDDFIKVITSKISVQYSFVTQSTFPSFSPSNLIVHFPNLNSFNRSNGNVMVNNFDWRPMAFDKDQSYSTNLLGTIRTLDGVNGSYDLNCTQYTNEKNDQHCRYGVVDSSGFTILDDSGTPVAEAMQEPPYWWYDASRSVTPSPPGNVCSSVPINYRTRCSSQGAISREDCEARGCCYIGVDNDHQASTCFNGPFTPRDLYIIRYDLNYARALQIFSHISGSVPLISRALFGIWESRYYEYSDTEIMNNVKTYSDLHIPLDILVIDMDWHKHFEKQNFLGVLDQANFPKGWVGYTWEKQLFPNPEKTIATIKEKNLLVSGNIHFASGIQPWENTYVQMASQLHQDASLQKYVAFNPLNRTFFQAYSEITLRSLEDKFDFWWMDWQQGEEFLQTPNVNPTFWLNHLFFDKDYPLQNKNGTVNRPFILHRWGGLGNHRYPIGFSGDSFPTFETLAFEVYMTLTASNVLFAYWSHDLGGHSIRPTDELYIRWLQFGAYSPIFRPHCSDALNNDRRIWSFDSYSILRDIYRIRSNLVPYIYTHAYHLSTLDIPLIRPMYYSWSKEKFAYPEFFGSTQYMFGSSLLVSPITHTSDSKNSNLAVQEIWFPSDECFFSEDWGIKYCENEPIKLSFLQDEIPVFGIAGKSMISRQRFFELFHSDSIGLAKKIPDVLEFVIFAGGSQVNITSSDDPFAPLNYIYEDDGYSKNYLRESPKFIEFNAHSNVNSFNITIKPNSGLDNGSRFYDIVILGSWPADAFSVRIQEKATPFLRSDVIDSTITTNFWTFDGLRMSLRIGIREPRNDNIIITVQLQTIGSTLDPLLSSGVPFIIKRARRARSIVKTFENVYDEDIPSLNFLCGVGEKLSVNPNNAYAIVKSIAPTLKKVPNEISNLAISDEIKNELNNLLSDRIMN